MKSRTHVVTCFSEAMSPLTHMGRTSGNEAIVAQEPVITEGGVTWVPMLSGNALRHRLIREPGARWLVETYGLVGKLSLPQLNFLFHGGALTEGGGREDTQRIADMQRLFPFLRLLGGSLPDQILAGSLLVGRGTLVCRENIELLRSLLPGGSLSLTTPLRPAEEFVDGYQYTRGDGRKTYAGLLRSEEREPVEIAPSNLMIFSGRAITRGACFVHTFTLPNVALVELGALLWSLRLWQASGGTIGGQGARGHGKLGTSLVGVDFDQDGPVAAYIGHAESVRNEAVDWLERAFAKRAEKVATNPRSNGKAAKV